MNPIKPLDKALAHEDVCPRCLGELDTGWECNTCGHDAYYDFHGLTEAEAQAAYDAAESVPLTEERIREIVDKATDEEQQE